MKQDILSFYLCIALLYSFTKFILIILKYGKHFIIYPQMVRSENRRPQPTGRKVPEGFPYSSGNNTEWLSVEQIKELLKTVDLEK